MPINYKASGATIYAEDYNRLQTKVAAILGQGGGIHGADYGYGQTIKSSQVSAVNDLVTVEQMNNLRQDIMTCWFHQTSDAFPLLSVASTDTITAGAGTTSAIISEAVNKTYNDYTWVVNKIDIERLSATPGSMNLVNDKASMSFSNWNSYRVHEVVVTFIDSNHKRYFFNSGGEIRLQSQHVGSFPSTSKPYIWQELLSSAGVTKFGYDDYISSTSAPSVLLLENPNASAVYAENYYKIYSSAPSASTLLFKIVFNDADTGDRPVNSGPPPYGALVDENVTGTTKSTLSIYYPSMTYVDPRATANSYTGVTLTVPNTTSRQGTSI